MSKRIGVGTAVTAAAVAMLIALAGCGESSAGGEEFREADGTSGTYRQMADQIMADGKVDRAEAEQAIASQYRCLAEHQISGEYYYDLDVYPWSQGTMQLDTEVQWSIPRPERFNTTQWTDELSADFSEWLSTADGKAWNAKVQQEYDKRVAQCAMFDEVEDMVFSTIDWSHYEKAKFEAAQRCIATNAPNYRDRAAEVQWGMADTSTANQQLEQAVTGSESGIVALANAAEGSEEWKLRECLGNNPNGKPTIAFGE